MSVCENTAADRGIGTGCRKQFHSETGATITDYIRRVKIDTADYLMSQREYSVTEIADLLGYTASYFSRVYKKQRGYSPRCLKQLY